MNEQEQFRLALKGYKFKATLNDWYYEVSNADSVAQELNIIGHDSHGEVELPPHVIVEKRRINKNVVIFLENNTCYELGTERGDE